MFARKNKCVNCKKFFRNVFFLGTNSILDQQPLPVLYWFSDGLVSGGSGTSEFSDVEIMNFEEKTAAHSHPLSEKSLVNMSY